MPADLAGAGESRYQASWIIPVDAPPIRNGVISIRAGTIQAVTSESTGVDSAINLDEWVGGAAVVLPGLVNAHTHLEFDVTTPLGDANRPITEWIPNVIGWRRQRDAEPELGAAAKCNAIRANLAQSHNAGVTRIGEIATPTCRPSDYLAPIRSTLFLELIALSDARNEPARQLAFEHLDDSLERHLASGLSPHAPYTVNLELLEDAIDLSDRTGARLQMHLAETQEELELIAAASGPFRQMLESVGAWKDSNLPLGLRPLDYLERLAKSSGCTIAHGNYLADDEIRFLAEHRDRLSVAYCPRTHAYFGHPPYPLTKMLEWGVNVALGTDSLASNPDLSILNEIKYLAANAIASPEAAVQMATMGGAEALGLRNVGALRPGNAAELTVLRTDSDAADPYELVIGDTTYAAASMVEGVLSPPFVV